jgi:hypothetical protein
MARPKKQPSSEPIAKHKKGFPVPSREDLDAVAEKYNNPAEKQVIFNEKIADEICEAIATHPYGLEKICKKFPHFPGKTTIWLWKLRHPEFADKYYKAKLAQAELHTEEILNISDDVSADKKINHEGNEVTNNEAVNRSRLKVDTRKWIAAKLLPKQYGDKQLVEDLQAENESLRREMLEYRRILDDKNKKEY